MKSVLKGVSKRERLRLVCARERILDQKPQVLGAATSAVGSAVEKSVARV